MRIDRIKLKTELVKREMMQKDFAELAGLSRGTTSGILNGRACNDETARKIAKALDMSIDDLKEQ